MTLTYGEELGWTCEQLGNFPAGQVANFDTLRFYHNATYAGKLFKASSKATFRDAFEDGVTAEDLLTWGGFICDYANWATQGAPLTTILRRRKPVVKLRSGFGSYIIDTSSGLPFLKGTHWSYEWDQDGTITDADGIGSPVFDIDAGPTTTLSITYLPNGAYYSEAVFFCELTVNYTIVNPTAHHRADVSVGGTATLRAAHDVDSYESTEVLNRTIWITPTPPYGYAAIDTIVPVTEDGDGGLMYLVAQAGYTCYVTAEDLEE